MVLNVGFVVDKVALEKVFLCFFIWQSLFLQCSTFICMASWDGKWV